MHTTALPGSSKTYGILFACAVIGATLLAVLTGLWVLTAISIGLLFGFFLQKGDLCGASAFSEVLLMKEWGKIRGLWVCIVVGMVGFAILNAVGWISLNPKPLTWANYIIGGIIFGIGMVLAGGCISGCLYKAGAGNLNSMVALPGIALGVASVIYGPLKPFADYLKKNFIIAGLDGGSVTLSTLTGISYPILAVFFLTLTLAAAVFMKRKPALAADPMPTYKRVFKKSWKPWAAGLMIGILGSAAYLSSTTTGRDYPLGVTKGVLYAQMLITEQNLVPVYRKGPPPAIAAVSAPASASRDNPTQPAGKKVSVWLIALVVSLVAGSWFSAKLSGTARLLSRPPEQVIIAFFGGLLVGAGAAIATGCVIGNIISGWALMSVGNILFGVTVVLANWAATYFYLMGGSLRS